MTGSPFICTIHDLTRLLQGHQMAETINYSLDEEVIKESISRSSLITSSYTAAFIYCYQGLDNSTTNCPSGGSITNNATILVL